MNCTGCPSAANRVPLAALLFLVVITGTVMAQTEKDPNRPACANAHCRKIKSFLKTHYCGDSPYGNGPDEGCFIKAPKARTNVEIVADYQCKRNDTKGTTSCKQQGQPSSETRTILMSELSKLGLPSDAKGQIYFRQWKSKLSSWSLATADYSRLQGSDLELCDVVVAIDQNSSVLVLRKLPFKKTDADVPDVTTWWPIDFADVDGDGQIEIILEADAYENHWLEVISIHNGSARMIFSGLGYYL
jgi:hypothetical protein